MITIRCLMLPLSLCGPCCLLRSACRIVVMLAVLVLAVILVLRGHLPGIIAGPVLVLVADTAWAADWLMGLPRARAVSALPAR
jgi:hypothetical protein